MALLEGEYQKRGEQIGLLSIEMGAFAGVSRIPEEIGVQMYSIEMGNNLMGVSRPSETCLIKTIDQSA